ncbi:MAG: HNH endonuclease [Chthonomonadaceae bacterium]|nr:HNH endonuclease [Chthonomonadaceae bacterium]
MSRGKHACLGCSGGFALFGTRAKSVELPGYCRACTDAFRPRLNRFRTELSVLLGRSVAQPEHLRSELLRASHDSGIALPMALHYSQGVSCAYLQQVLTFFVADQKLDQSEEDSFRELKDALQVPGSAIAPLMDQLHWYSTVSKLRRGELPRVQTAAILMPDEIAHLQVPARYYRQLTSSYRLHQGQLLATNRRLLFTQTDGPFEAALSKVVGVHLVNENRIQIDLVRRQGSGTYDVGQAHLVVETLRAILAVANREVVAQAASSRVIPADVKSAVYRRDGGRCVQCGAGDYLEFDHILPFSKGGATSVSNLQLLCRRCNLAKGAKL